jgi:hypothetical protein
MRITHTFVVAIISTLGWACDDPRAESSPAAREKSPVPPTAQTAGDRTAPIPTTTPTTSPRNADASQDRGDAQETSDAERRLYGTWAAENVSSPIGDVRIRLVIRREGPLRILAWSELPMVGKVREKEASYEINGDTISSEALRGGTSARYRFEGGNLLLTLSDGRTVRFTRKP